jgi:lysophospholipase L1-like esterase
MRGYGVSGALTRDVLDEQLARALDDAPAPDAVLIEVGSNDVTHATPLVELERDTERLVERGLAEADVVILGGAGRMGTTNLLRPLRDLVMWRARAVRGSQHEVIRAAQRDAGTSRVAFVNVGGEPLATVYADTPGATSGDAFHPAAAGYAVWADAFADALTERLDT